MDGFSPAPGCCSGHPLFDAGGRVDWIEVTAMPESYYLAGIQTGSRRTAMFSVVALAAAILLAALLAGVVSGPMQRISQSAEAMAQGDLTQRAGKSGLRELNALVESFNRMAEQLQESFGRTLASQQTLKATFNTSPAAMIVFDSSTLQYGGFDFDTGMPIVDINEAWLKITGHSRETLIGHSSSRLELWGSEHERQRFVAMLIQDGYVNNFEAPLRKADGSTFFGLLAVRSAKVGAGQLSILAIEDITERKEAGRQAARRAERSGRAEPAAGSARARAHAGAGGVKREAASRDRRPAPGQGQADPVGKTGQPRLHRRRGGARAQYAIGVGVTVASTMQGKTEAIQQHSAAGTLRRSQLEEYMQAQQEGMQLLLQALSRTGDLVANFKRVAVDQGSAQRRSFSLQRAVDDVAALTRASMRKAPYTLEIDVPEDLTMDSFPGAIEQVIINLCNNSIAHGFAGRDHGVMRVSARAEGETVQLVYTDDGKGMNAEVLRRIFDPFFTTALGKGGSGLGMAICYNLVTGPLGGSISVASEIGQGCRFTIILPRIAPAGNTAAAAVAV